MAEEERQGEKKQMQEVSASFPFPLRAETQHNTTVIFKLNSWDQISLELEYLTNSSNPLKVYLLLAYWNMNVTVFKDHFGIHPSTVCDDKIRDEL